MFWEATIAGFRSEARLTLLRDVSSLQRVLLTF